MRLTWGSGVERNEYRFDGEPACEVAAKAVLWVDLIGPALWDKGAVSNKAKWLITGQAVEPSNATSVLASLPAPEWVESEAPVLVNEPPSGLGLIPPCYALAIKPHQPAMLELTLTVSVGKEVEQAATRVRAVPAGALAESAQEKLERLLRAFDVDGLRALLAPLVQLAPDDEPGAAGTTRAGDGDGDTPGEAGNATALVWTSLVTGENLLHTVLTRVGVESAARAEVFTLLLRAGASAPSPSAVDVLRADAPPSPLHEVVARREHALAARMLELPGVYPAHCLCLWRGRRCTTPLHVACENGDGTMADLLLSHGAKADWAGATGRAGSATPLALAIEAGAVELARTLIVEKLADVRLRTLDPSFSALALACRGPNAIPMIRMLLEVNSVATIGALCHSARAERPLQETLTTASALGLAPVVSELVRLGADVPGHQHPDGRSLLYDAVERGHAATVARLLAARADPSSSGASPLLSPLTAAACLDDASLSRKVLFMLRQAGADAGEPDRAGRTALEYARKLEGPFRPGSDLVIADLLAELPEPELPKQWAMAVDPTLGQTYYFHTITKEVSWQPPRPALAQVE